MRDRTTGNVNLILGLLGAICLLAILPVKAIRIWGHDSMSLVIGVAPSLLGPAGLLFLLLSSTGRLARLGVLQVVLLVGAISFALEFAQLIPRPGPLARIRYSFDHNDLIATVLGLGLAYGIAGLILWRTSRPTSGGRP